VSTYALVFVLVSDCVVSVHVSIAPAVFCTCLAPAPRITVFEAVATALAPITVVFVRAAPESDPEPMHVLLDPVVTVSPARLPMKVLVAPDVAAMPAWYPMHTLLAPSARAKPAETPMQVLLPPVVMTRPARDPMSVLLM
jgi:hypothetical protein